MSTLDSKASEVGNGIVADNTNWSFGGSTVNHFGDHIRQSVPFYDAGHDLVCELSDFFVKDSSICYELGSSLGELSLKLADRHTHRNHVQWIGLDREHDMVDQANRLKTTESVSFLCEDCCKYPYEKSDFIVAYYTVQFIEPRDRQELITRLYNALNWGGALVLFEKVRGPDARFQDIATMLYTEFKLKNQFTPDEIIGKSRSLKGVLEPFSTQGNLDLLTRAGFTDVMTVMKYICFEGFLAIK
jgi:tRNA (cmo5U34)-methyltransferase